MNIHKNIAIVGVGVVSPYGVGIESLRKGIQGSIASYSLNSKTEKYVMAKCEDKLLCSHSTRGKDRTSKMTLVALEEALETLHGCINTSPDMLGVYSGCACGGLEADYEGYKRFFTGRPISPLSIVKSMSNSPLAEICLRVGAKGSSINYSLACASSSIAIHEARKALLAGEIDMAIAGGVETPLTETSLAAWNSMGVMNNEMAPNLQGCRPFDKDRKGLVLGEGAAFFILERVSTAISKGRNILAVLSGSGVSTDSKHITTPCSEGQEVAIKKALKSAGLVPNDICLYNAHGTGTEIGDITEATTIKKVWGNTQPTISATKCFTGHLLGAAGALELAIILDNMMYNYIPSNINLNSLDERCKVNLRKERLDDVKINHAVSSSFAFGGHNVVLVLSKSYD
ncbi:beta-ketoacyl-[acyl-carrier-protein] synthase family protein [Vibrio rotiferianus]|uniref:beta-ketoacyl-[acyl-carrier-protein] synthase family protein n=1 Tax=Vibrio rotiferianus TaxID=190895 RepID=UPI00406A35A5